MRFSGLLGMTFALAFAGCLVFEMPFVALERAVSTGRRLNLSLPPRMNLDKLSDEIPRIFATLSVCPSGAKPKNAKRSRRDEEDCAPLREQAAVTSV